MVRFFALSKKLHRTRRGKHRSPAHRRNCYNKIEIIATMLTGEHCSPLQNHNIINVRDKQYYAEQP